MSLEVRYLTNGKKTIYTVKRNDVPQRSACLVYDGIEDIPQDIRHYAPKCQPVFVTPDVAQFLGLGGILYPEYQYKCSYGCVGPTHCLGPGCAMLTPENPNPQNCKYWKDDE